MLYYILLRMHICFFVVLDLVYQYQAKILAGKNVSKMTHLCRVGRKTQLNSTPDSATS